eukprot:249508_1
MSVDDLKDIKHIQADRIDTVFRFISDAQSSLPSDVLNSVIFLCILFLGNKVKLKKLSGSIRGRWNYLDAYVGTEIVLGGRVKYNVKYVSGDRYKYGIGLIATPYNIKNEIRNVWDKGDRVIWYYSENGRYPTHGNANIDGCNYGSGLATNCTALVDLNFNAGTLQISVLDENKTWMPGDDGKGLPAPGGKPGWFDLRDVPVQLFVVTSQGGKVELVDHN